MAWLYLIRHPHTQQDPLRPASAWTVSDTGRAQIEALVQASFWHGVEAVYTSPQPKTIAVAEAVVAAHDLPHMVIDGLTEARRDTWLGADMFAASQRVFFAQRSSAPVVGWEAADAALTRFNGAMRQVLARHDPNASLAVVTHGTVLALYVAHLRQQPPTYEFWESIGFATVVAVPRGTLRPTGDFVAAPYTDVPE